MRINYRLLPLLLSFITIAHATQGETLVEENVLVTASRVAEDASRLPLAWSIDSALCWTSTFMLKSSQLFTPCFGSSAMAR